MAKKTSSRKAESSNPGASSPASKVSTSVRNTAIPRGAEKKEITQEQIARRAYEIANSGNGGSELDNWLRAERELRGL